MVMEWVNNDSYTGGQNLQYYDYFTYGDPDTQNYLQVLS